MYPNISSDVVPACISATTTAAISATNAIMGKFAAITAPAARIILAANTAAKTEAAVITVSKLSFIYVIHFVRTSSKNPIACPPTLARFCNAHANFCPPSLSSEAFSLSNAGCIAASAATIAPEPRLLIVAAKLFQLSCTSCGAASSEFFIKRSILSADSSITVILRACLIITFWDFAAVVFAPANRSTAVLAPENNLLSGESADFRRVMLALCCSAAFAAVLSA